MRLSHLFTATFANGTQLRQTPEDVDAANTTKSAFTELLRAIEQGHQLVRFELDGPRHTYAVDLTDGHFEIDGLRQISEPPPTTAPLRIIYFRRNTITALPGLEGVDHAVSYVIGWQTNDMTGRNIQQTIEVV